MKTVAIKEEINKIIEKLPEKTLSNLKQIEKNSIEAIHSTKSLRKILIEDRELLEKLAK